MIRMGNFIRHKWVNNAAILSVQVPVCTRVKSTSKVRPGRTAVIMNVNVQMPVEGCTNVLKGKIKPDENDGEGSHYFIGKKSYTSFQMLLININ